MSRKLLQAEIEQLRNQLSVQTKVAEKYCQMHAYKAMIHHEQQKLIDTQREAIAGQDELINKLQSQLKTAKLKLSLAKSIIDLSDDEFSEIENKLKQE